MAPPLDRGGDPHPPERRIWPVRATYTSILADLLAVLARAVRVALTAPPASEEQRREEYRVRYAARRAHELVGTIGIQAAQDAVAASAEDGTEQARIELRRLGRDPDSPIDQRAVRLIQAELDGRLRAAHLAILREPEDVYRRVIAEATLLAPADDGSRRLHVAQHALNRFADEGVTGFTDRRGRRWNIISYVEMATRTAATRAYTDAYAEWLVANGTHYVYVTDVPGECELCRPWEGKILRLRPAPGAESFPVTFLAPDKTTFVRQTRVAGTLDQARAAGLFHPNCRHRAQAWSPDGLFPVGEVIVPVGQPDPDGYQARQELRRLERGVRKWKLREAAALDPAARKTARRKVRAWQAAIRTHVDETGVPRQRRREQIGVAL